MGVNSLYLAGPGSVALDMREDDIIIGISLSGNSAAGGGMEVSFMSTASLTTNDTTGVLAGVIHAAGIPAHLYFILNEKIAAGERLYLHNSGVGNNARAFIFTEGASSKPSTRRR